MKLKTLSGLRPFSYVIEFNIYEIYDLFKYRQKDGHRVEYYLNSDIECWLVDNDIDYCRSYYRPDLGFKTQSDYLAFRLTWG